jgi:hypothetical protein
MAMVCLPMFAQKKHKYNEKDFRCKQQIYMTEKAGLTSEEAEKFFPIYFELQDKKKALNKQRWAKTKQGRNPGTTEEEYNTIINQFLDTETDILDLKKEYIEKFRKVLSNQKIYMIYWAEIKFNRNMMKILQEMEDKKK